MKLKNLKYLVPKSKYYKIIILQLNSFLVILLEMLSLGLVPILVLLITDYNFFLEIFKNYDYFGLLSSVETLKKNEFIAIFSFIFLIIFLFKNLFIILLNYTHNKFIKDLKVSTMQLLFKNFLNKNFLFYLNENPSILIRKITTDVSHAYNYLSSYMKLIRESVLVIIIIFSLIYIDPILYTVIFTIFVVLTIMMYFLFRVLLKKRSFVQQSMHSENLKNLTQLFNSIKEVKIFSKENYFYEIFKKNMNTLENVNFFNNFLSTLPRVFFEIISITAIVSLIIAFIIFGKTDTFIISTISLLGVAIVRFVPAFNLINVSLSSLRWFLPSIEVIIKDLKSVKHFSRKKNSKSFFFQKQIELDDISFSYSKKIILKNVNLKISKGEKVGIVGISGSGKTTLINILMGLIKPSSGKIFLDNKLLNNDNLEILKNIGYVPQDPYLLDDTIQNNILFGSRLEKKRLKKIIKNSQLENLIYSLKNKENTKVGNTGSRVSGGQKQRLSIARALYNEPEMIILDEATSALDHETETKIIENVFNTNKNKTIILITHKKSLLTYCEKVFEIKSGNVHTHIK
jgi:ABC-type multidrug transport system fused ATPase/permease subunit